MWFPFQLSKKDKTEGPHYAGYNERAIATTLDLVVFLFFMLQPIYWMEQKIRSFYSPTTDLGIFERAQPQAQGLELVEQVKLALQVFVESGIWKMFLATNLTAIFMVLSVYVACLLLFQTTPGKWLMGVKITRADHERFPAWWQIIFRSFFAVISCIPFMLGFIWMMFDSQSRTWHDMAAGTRVVTTRPEGWYWQKTKEGFRWLRTQISGTPPSEPPPNTPL